MSDDPVEDVAADPAETSAAGSDRRPGRSRSARIAEAMADLERQAAQERAEQQERAAERAARMADKDGRPVDGRPPAGTEIVLAEQALAAAVAAARARLQEWQAHAAAAVDHPRLMIIGGCVRPWPGSPGPTRSWPREPPAAPGGSRSATSPTPSRGCSRWPAAAGCRATTLKRSPPATAWCWPPRCRTTRPTRSRSFRCCRPRRRWPSGSAAARSGWCWPTPATCRWTT